MIHSIPISSLSAIKSSGFPSTIQCEASTFRFTNENNTSRRGENHFQPTVWDYDYIQSMRVDFVVCLIHFTFIYLLASNWLKFYLFHVITIAFILIPTLIGLTGLSIILC